MTTASGPTGAPVADQKTLTMVNTFVAQTVDMLNRLNAACERKLADAQRCARTSRPVASGNALRPAPRLPPPSARSPHPPRPPFAQEDRIGRHHAQNPRGEDQQASPSDAPRVPRSTPRRAMRCAILLARDCLFPRGAASCRRQSPPSVARPEPRLTDPPRRTPRLLTQRGGVRRRAVDERDGDESAAADGFSRGGGAGADDDDDEPRRRTRGRVGRRSNGIGTLVGTFFGTPRRRRSEDQGRPAVFAVL